MKKKLIITETQLERLKIILKEENQHARFVKQLRTELDTYYEPVEKFIRKGGEYNSSAMVKNKVDEQELSIADLFAYMKHKFNISDKNNELLKQIIKDWMFGNIDDDNTLSKNVPLV